MRIDLFIKWEDIEKYEHGEEVYATDLRGKSAIFNHNDRVLPVSISSRDIIRREDILVNGFVSGKFDKYIIQKM